MDRPPSEAGSSRLDRAGFEDLRRRMSGLGPPGQHPRAALEYITAAHVLAAAEEVRTGRHVSLAAPVATARTPDAPEPARHP